MNATEHEIHEKLNSSIQQMRYGACIRLAKYGQLATTIFADQQEVIDFLSGYFGPFVPVDAKCPTDVAIYSCSNDDVFTSLQHHLEAARTSHPAGTPIRLPSIPGVAFLQDFTDGVDDFLTVCIHDSGSKTIFIAASRSRDGTEPRFVMRVARAQLKIALLESGHVPFHAAAFAKGNAGVMLLGSKGAGKTTTLLSCLASKEYSLICNSETFATVIGAEVFVRALPMAVAIRAGTLAVLPELRACVARQELPKSPRWHVPMHLLCDLYSVDIQARAQLRVAVKVNFDSARRGTAMRVLSQEEILTLLRRAIHEKKSSYERYWDASLTFDLALREETQKVVQMMATNVAFYDLSFGAVSPAELQKSVRSILSHLK